MRALSRNSWISVRPDRGARRQPQGRARRAPSCSRMTKPVPPQCAHGPSSNSPIAHLRPGAGAQRKAPDTHLVEIALELLAFLRAVQLLERLGLDLPDALARQPHHLADLLERSRLSLVEPEAQSQDLLLLRVEGPQTGIEMILQRRPHQLGVRRRDEVLLQLVGQVEF